MLQKFGLLNFTFLTLANGTSVADGRVVREEMCALLVPWAYCAGMVSLGFKVVGSDPWANSTVCTEFSLNGCHSTLGSL